MKKEVSLRKFVEESYQLLTIIGVFVALTTYFSSSIFKLDPMFSFIAKIMLFLLVLELFIDNFNRFFYTDREKPSISLAIFLLCFFWLIVGIYIQLLSTEYELIIKFSTPLLILIYLISILTILNHYNVREKLSKKYKWFDRSMDNYLYRRIILRFIILIATILLAIFIISLYYILNTSYEILEDYVNILK